MSFIRDHWFLWLMMLGASALSFVWLYSIHKKLRMKWWEAIAIPLLSFLFGIIGSLIINYFENGFEWENIGTSVYGAIFISPLVAYIGWLICGKRFKYLQILDNVTIVLAIFMVLTRINCIKSGCCYGSFIGGSDFRYPTREADILINILFLIFSIGNILKEKLGRYHYFVYLIVYGLGRFIIEWFRVSNTTMPLHFGHIWSLIAIMIGAIFVTLIFINDKKVRTDNVK